MRYLRMFLITVSIVCVVWLALAAKIFAGEYGRGFEAAALLGFATLIAANLYYLISIPAPTTGAGFRPLRMFSLWMKSKERDLERRATGAD